jgi:hypothetical protein
MILGGFFPGAARGYPPTPGYGCPSGTLEEERRDLFWKL